VGGLVGGWLDIGWDLVYFQECLLNSFSSAPICWRIEIVFCFFWRERRSVMVALGRFSVISVAKGVEKFRVVIYW
jgi:hypothetical protein